MYNQQWVARVVLAIQNNPFNHWALLQSLPYKLIYDGKFTGYLKACHQDATTFDSVTVNV